MGEPDHRLPGSSPQPGELRQPDRQREGLLSPGQLRGSVQQLDLQGRRGSGAGELPDCRQHWGPVVLCGSSLLLLSGPRPLTEVPQQPLVLRGLCHPPSHLPHLPRCSCSRPPCRPSGPSSSCCACCPSGACPAPCPPNLPSPPAPPCRPLLCGGCWRSGTDHPGDL